MPEGKIRRAAFLDRDGVINADRGYTYRTEDFLLLDGVLEAAAELSRAGYLLVVITNQSGIGRGYYSEEDFLRLTRKMCLDFKAAGAPVSGVYFCPHHPEKALGAYRCACSCRKPAPGLIFRAAEELGIDLPASVFFGDKRSDMKAALAAGIPVRILLGTDGRAVPAPVEECTGVSLCLATAVRKLLGPDAG